MSDESSSKPMVSSPASTGGAGTVFEQHVGAYWLSLLLVRAIPPIINDCTLAEIHFQTEHLGFRTDDFLVVGETSTGIRRRLVGQIKRSFVVSTSDTECRMAFRDFWGDFSRSDKFDRANDRLVLVTMRGTNTLLEHFAGLLDCARAARDAPDFIHRLETPGFVHAKVVDYFRVIQTILREAEGQEVAPEVLWSFLCGLHILSLDLTTSSGQTEALIKTLLAHTATTRDPLGAAGATWVALVGEAGDSASHAKGHTRETLPPDLRERHGPIATADLRFLRALVDHSTPILKEIRRVLGPGVHLTRERLVQAVLACVSGVQVVFLTGPAGSGKSVIARDVLAVLEADHFCFSFRAEEFATVHLDTTLQHAQMPGGAMMLRAILAGQARKVALVESIERLLEASTRDAFSDLLNLAREDRGWTLLFTCRDYSLDLIQSSFLERAGMPHLVVDVPPLDDSELDEVEAACPAIRRPLSNPPLRRLMRNPYVLDMALRMPWPEGRPLPGDEREFRARFWREVVRADHRTGCGMPQRREATFVEVAVRRARALAVHARCGDLDAEALEGLRADSLISCPPDRTSLAAPAHDVLEDWAILEWIEDQKDRHGDAVAEFSGALGTDPAIRRTYRKWAQELVDREPDSADRLFRSVLEGRHQLPAHFRDDTLIAILQSPSASDFLSRHEEALLGRDSELLRRIVHLLRVGCLKVPDRADGSPRLVGALAIPDGSAWPCVLRLVRDNLGWFSEADAPLLLGLIEDWARGVSPQTPYPEGCEAVATIAHHLLGHYDSYRNRDQRKSVLRIVAKIPEGDPERFDGLLRGRLPGGVRDHASDDLRKIVLTGLESLPACRDMPTLVVSVTREHLLLDEADLRSGRMCARLREVEVAFGIQERCYHDFDPPSAWRGPFYSLLRCHPRIGLDFILELVNSSTTWYGEGKYRSRDVERPARITLTFPDRTTVEQWCSPRLWDLYRGVAPALGVLQCALMALEVWLFQYAEAYEDDLDRLLGRILKEGRSVASTSVVASLVTAFPDLSCEALLTLLSSPECIHLDRGRMLGEYSVRFRRSSAWLAEDRICDSERRAADERPHRRRDLEAAVLAAQLGPLAPRVQRALDAHREKLPPIGEQRERDRIWRLALDRMDLRRYSAVVETRPGGEVQDQAGEPARRIRFEPTRPEADLQEILDREGGQGRRAKTRVATWTWAISVFRNTDTDSSDPSLWRERLGEARDAVVEDGRAPQDEAGYGGPAVVAAVCVRDHWEEMASDERAWCAIEICAAIEEGCDDWIRNDRAERIEHGER